MSQGSGKVPETTDLLLSGFSEVGERRALGSRSNSNLRLPVTSYQFPAAGFGPPVSGKVLEVFRGCCRTTFGRRRKEKSQRNRGEAIPLALMT